MMGLQSWFLGPGSWILLLGSPVPGPVSWVTDPMFGVSVHLISATKYGQRVAGITNCDS